MYWNAAGEEKLLESGWLISAIPAKFNHLRGARRGAPPATFHGDSYQGMPSGVPSKRGTTRGFSALAASPPTAEAVRNGAP